MSEEIDDAAVAKVAEELKQWMFTSGDITRPILPANKFAENMDNKYGLLNTKVDKHVAYKDGNLGIDMEFAPRSRKRERVIVSRCGDTTEPIKYGENVAIGYGISPTWINHGHQKYGPNVGFELKPSCEWKVLGGPIGTPVQTNERVALFNEKYKASPTESGEFVFYFDRPLPKTWKIGTPTSQGAREAVGEWFGENWDTVLEVVVALFLSKGEE